MHERMESMEEAEVGPEVRRVNLRQNRITRISLLPWLAQLEELDLYDNGISVIENLDGCTNLRYGSTRSL
jgi:Leucine-rich repeat (LRR) protein